MIYYTGDIHGNPNNLIRFCRMMALTERDIVVLLGDVGANYFRDERDRMIKARLSGLKPTFLCIHGNHEIRPANIPSYQLREWNGGKVWYEEDFPKLLFAKDGEIFELGGRKHLVIGGAYSVDKSFRLAKGHGWWPDEQPSEEIKAYVEQQVQGQDFDVILSHTCPFKYIPTEAFLPGIDQTSVDNSTERWLDRIEDMADYKEWYCGHWHINKNVDKIHFLYWKVAAHG